MTEIGPGMRYRFSGSGTTGTVNGGRAVGAMDDPDEAEFTYTVELTLTGFLRLARPVVANTMRKSLRADLQRLRAVLEASG